MSILVVQAAIDSAEIGVANSLVCQPLPVLPSNQYMWVYLRTVDIPHL